MSIRSHRNDIAMGSGNNVLLYAHLKYFLLSSASLYPAIQEVSSDIGWFNNTLSGKVHFIITAKVKLSEAQ